MHKVIECRSTEQVMEDRMFEVLDMLRKDLTTYVNYGSVYVGRSDHCHSGYQADIRPLFTNKQRAKALALVRDIEQAILEGRVIDTFSRVRSLYF